MAGINFFNSITVEDIYRCKIDELTIPKDYRIVSFEPPNPKQSILSVLSHTIVKVTAVFPALCPRIIVEEIEPCELCGEKEPVTLTEIKKSSNAKNFSLMMLCAGCIDNNRKFIK